MKIYFIGAFSLILSGCGNNLLDSSKLKDDTTMVGYAAEIEDDEAAADAYTDYSCGADYSIKPIYNPSGDVSGQNLRDFKGCGSTTSAWKSIIVTKDSSLSRVCVYPAQYIDATHIYLKPDILQPGKYLSTCVELGTAGPHAAALEYTNVNYNYFFVVDETKKTQMEACLASPMNLANCESIISKGKFR